MTTTVTARARRSVRNRENTRRRLLEAAATVFIDKGFAGARIDDVVREAGFTRGAFYSNYSSMDEIMREVILDHAENLLAEVHDALDHTTSDPGVGAVLEILEKIRPRGREMYIFNTEYTLYLMRHPEAVRISVTDHQRFNRILSSIIEEALERMGRTATVPPEVLADVLGGFFLDSFAATDTDDTDLSRSLLATVVDGMIRGLSRPTITATPANAPHLGDDS